MLSPSGMIRAAASTGATKVRVPMRAKTTAEVRKNIFAGTRFGGPGESWSLAGLEDREQSGVFIQEFLALRGLAFNIVAYLSWGTTVPGES